MTPILSTLIATAVGFAMQLENGCRYEYVQMSEKQANIYVCGEITGYVYKNRYYESK